MSRRCARPGCDRPAVATLTYAYADRTVWVDDLATHDHPMEHDLCVDHAARVTVPVGWACRDRRLLEDPARPAATTSLADHLADRVSA